MYTGDIKVGIAGEEEGSRKIRETDSLSKKGSREYNNTKTHTHTHKRNYALVLCML